MMNRLFGKPKVGVTNVSNSPAPGASTVDTTTTASPTETVAGTTTTAVPSVVPVPVPVPSVVPSGDVTLKILNDDGTTNSIQFNLTNNKLSSPYSGGKIQIANNTKNADGTFVQGEFKDVIIDNTTGILSIQAPIVTANVPYNSGPPPPAAANPINGGSTRRRAYRPRKGTRRNRITR